MGRRFGLGTVVGLAILVLTAAACMPPPAPPSPAAYLDKVYSDLRTTPEATPLSYGAAPPRSTPPSARTIPTGAPSTVRATRSRASG